MKRQKHHCHEEQPSATNPSGDSACISAEAIACRAHERYIRRGGTHGQDVDDWLEAERELREELANKH